MQSLIVLLFSAFTANAADLPQSANDNGLFPSKCILALLEKSSLQLTEKDGELIFNSNRRAIYDANEKELKRLVHSDKEAYHLLEQKQKAEVTALPDVILSSNGNLVERRYLPNGLAKITVRSGKDLSEIRSIELKLSEKAPHLAAVSNDGQYIVTTASYSTPIQLISLVTGKVLLEKSTNDKWKGLRYHFSADNHFTLNEAGKIETYKLNNDTASHLFTYYLGSNDVDLGEEQFIIPFSRDGIGQVDYLPKYKSYLSFYFGPEPLIIKLQKNSNFSVQSFDKAPVDYIHEPDTSEFKNLLDELKKPSYASTGLVNSSENLLIATRTQGTGPTYLTLIDIFSIENQKHIRTIPIPNNVVRIALSPDERFLAVSSNANEGVRVYDLKNPQLKPYAVIDFKNMEGSLLSFAADNVILAGSGNAGEVYRFTFPLPKD